MPVSTMVLEPQQLDMLTTVLAPPKKRVTMPRRILRTGPPALRVLNWGWGQDSTTIALMSKHGELPPLDAILCADTQQEPDEVYETVEWVSVLLEVPVYRVTVGDLGAAILQAAREHKEGKRLTAGHVGQPPFYVKNDPNKDYATAVSGGVLRRKCTHDYKIVPIRQKLRKILGVSPVGRLPKHMWVEQWIGFPVEELGRTFCSDVQWITNTFPLIDKRMRKTDCERWLREHGYPSPIPKSSCRFCPFHTNAYWRRMRDTQPQEWAKVVAFEAELHQGKLPGVRGTPYVHKSMVPLPLAPIDEDDNDRPQLDCWACHT